MKTHLCPVILLVAALTLGMGWGSAAALPSSPAAASPPVAQAAPAATYNCATATGIDAGDCGVLVDLYNSTNGAGWTTTDWLTNSTPCAWYGVTCTGNRVTWLQLSGNHLVGTLPMTLGNLSALEILDLSANTLSGTIPSQLGNLTHLSWLILSNNSLSGTIPASLGGLIDLQLFELNYNSLSGAIPIALGGLTDVVVLNVSNNQLTGTIPTQLGSLKDLQLLGLGSNQLSGTVPVELGSLTLLQQLDLSADQLSGALPAQLGNLTSMGQLFLTANAAVNRGLPQSLKSAPLWQFAFDTTGLCEPPDATFQGWLTNIATTGILARTNVQCAAKASTVAISRSTNDLVLSWTDQPPNTAYEVHRSSTLPYFTPSATTLAPPLLAQPTQTATDAGAYAAASNYYYVVRSKFTDSANDLSADSNRTGKFSFTLTPGK